MALTRRVWGLSLAVMALLAGLVPAGAGAAETRSARSAGERWVLAVYYPWYRAKPEGGKTGWEHVVDHPLIGPYDSLDPKLLAYHFRLARSSGIDGFVSSWNGPGDRTDQALQRMLSLLATGRHGPLKVGVYYETMQTPEEPRSEEKIERDLAYLVRRYGKEPGLLKVWGRPVVFVYTADSYPPEQWSGLLRRVSADAGPVYAVGDSLNPDYLSAFDGLHTYDNVYVPDGRLLEAYRAIARAAHRTPDKRLVATLIGGGRRVRKLGFDIDRSRGRFIQNRLRIARQAGADWLLVTSFKEWYEARQIEPSVEYGHEQMDAVRRASRQFKGATAPRPTKPAPPRPKQVARTGSLPTRATVPARR